MQLQNKTVNPHIKAAQRMAERLPHILTRSAKRMQQAAILRELVAGLRGKSNAQSYS